MSIDLNIYRAQIDLHTDKLRRVKGIKYLSTLEFLVFLSVLLYHAGDIDKNPGLENDSQNDTASFSTVPAF